MAKHIMLLPNGTEISSGLPSGNAIQSVSLTQAVNDAQVLSLGSTCASSVEISLFSPGGGITITAGDEIILFRENDAGERTQVGVFITEKPIRPTADTMKLTAFDRITKLDKDLGRWLYELTEWPYALHDFAVMVCDACGLTLVTEEIPNGDFLVQRFSGQGISGRKLMQWVGQVAGRFCRATPDGNIEFSWYTPAGVTITPAGDHFYYENTLRLEDYETYPIEKVQVHLTEDDVGAVWPDGPVIRKGGSVITVDDAANTPLQGLTLYGKTTQDGTPTPEAPVELVSAGASGAIKTMVVGKSLIPFPFQHMKGVVNGINYSVDNVGTITANGTPTDVSIYSNCKLFNGFLNEQNSTFYLPAGAYKLICTGQADTIKMYGVLYERFEDYTYRTICNLRGKSEKEFTLNQDAKLAYALLFCEPGYAPSNERIRIAIVPADASSEIPDYVTPQTLTASTPNGLPGIPVSSGGNYTDENGQQWICDEIDFAKGVYVKRVGNYVFNGSEAWEVQNNAWFIHRMSDAYTDIDPLFMSNVGRVPKANLASGYGFAYAYGARIKFENMNPMSGNTVDELKAYLAEKPITMVVRLKTPIETALSDEELTAYAALHTNKPNTTVYNDAGAYMEVTYMTGEKNTYRITGNYLLTADATDDLQPIAQSLYEQMKDVSYTPCSVTIAACDELQPGHIVQIADMNGKSYTVYVMRKTSRGMRDTIECMGPYRLDSTTIFNEQTYAALSGKVLEVNLKMEGLLVKASDLEAEQQNLNSKITETSTSVLNDCNQILMTALQSYVQTSNYEEFRQTVEAQVKLLRDEFSIKFEETDSKITEVDGDLQEKFNQIATIFEFTINGFKIGKVGSPYKIFLDDNEFSMMVNDERVLWFELSENSHEANIPELNVTKKLNLFGYLIDMDSYGNVNCEYVGGDT